MNANISPENEQYLQEAIGRGLFQDRSEALNVAVELLRREEALIRDVNAGIEQIEHGEVTPLDVQDIKERGRKRLAEEGRGP